MSFSYSFGNSPMPDYPRVLCGDTVAFNPTTGKRVYIFDDQEYQTFANICTSQWQSSQFYSPPAGQNLPGQPIPWLRVAALALDSMAANKSYLASVQELLDIKLDAGKSAEALRKQAQAYRDQDDNSGSFVIVEQVFDSFSWYERFWNQTARQQGLSF